jgi:hypothetical protein
MFQTQNSPHPFAENRVGKHSRATRLCVIATAAICLFGCEEEKSSIPYLGVNHTDKEVVSVVINGEGGILNVSAQGGGGKSVCCVTLPKHWRTGLKATIQWQLDGHWVRDAQGNIVKKDGVQQFVEGPWKTQTIDIPEYTEHDMAHFDVHFFPGDQVQVKVSFNYPEHPDYRPAYPEQKGE